jgi:hypothetical protein
MLLIYTVHVWASHVSRWLMTLIQISCLFRCFWKFTVADCKTRCCEVQTRFDKRFYLASDRDESGSHSSQKHEKALLVSCSVSMCVYIYIHYIYTYTMCIYIYIIYTYIHYIYILQVFFHLWKEYESLNYESVQPPVVCQGPQPASLKGSPNPRSSGRGWKRPAVDGYHGIST